MSEPEEEFKELKISHNKIVDLINSLNMNSRNISFCLCAILMDIIINEENSKNLLERIKHFIDTFYEKRTAK